MKVSKRFKKIVFALLIVLTLWSCAGSEESKFNSNFIIEIGSSGKYFEINPKEELYVKGKVLIKNIEISYTDPVELTKKSIHSEKEAEIPLDYTGSSGSIYVENLKDNNGKVLFSNIEKTLEKAQNISLKVSKESFVGTVMRIKDLGPTITLDSSNYKDYLDITIKDLGAIGEQSRFYSNQRNRKIAITTRSKRDDYLFYKCGIVYAYGDWDPILNKLRSEIKFKATINDEGKETISTGEHYYYGDITNELHLDEVYGRIYKKPQD